MKYYFPIHLDGGNRGCEAIAKGTAMLLGTDVEDNIGLCRDVSLDTRLGVNKFVTLQEANNLSFLQKVERSLEVHLTKDIHKQGNVIQKYDYMNFFKQIKEGDVMISTGGDMMCYGNNQVIYTNNTLHERGIKTILWGCSMGPENLTPEKEETLHKFSLIYARESLSYDFFRKIGLKNVCLLPDPAFVLKPEKCALPTCFDTSDVIGINLSNYVLDDFSLDTPFGKEIQDMFDYILKNTNLHVLLIPHVIWSEQDDRKVAQMVYNKYKETERFSVLDVDQLNYCQIRNVIGECKFFIGGRTHAVISAYSMCVPSIALGYSIKSKGIAKDLGLSEKLVVDSKRIQKGELVSSFEWIINNEKQIKNHMTDIMPSYIQSTYNIRNVLKSVI